MVGARDAEKAAAGARTEATLPRDHDGKGDMTSDAEREEHESASSSAVAASIPRGKILVVDDEPEIRETVRRILSKEGYEADIAESGRIALDKLESFRPALVLCDYVAGADRRLGRLASPATTRPAAEAGHTSPADDSHSPMRERGTRA